MVAPAQKNSSTGYPIYLYTTPTADQNKFWKRTVDVIGHWAICINGYCYELTRITPREKKYWIRCLPEKEWKRVKRVEGRRITERDPLGPTAKEWTHEEIKHIAELIWDGPLRNTYAYDRTNCQVFVRLLVDLVGDSTVKFHFPAFFDKRVKEAGMARDLTYFALSGAVIGANSAIATVCFCAAPLDLSGMLSVCGVAAGQIALNVTVRPS
ncbi:hypothetical protein FLONG3_10576 [Fusarium longipes]|uniref:Uncharacterized protein n=1 Tax=Fusarium longipes TaxID=694270 RepID=A0A395RN93_9HYPO|nr:hypothetical protein FLONG3_10576 [Fusarium longipes]